MKVTVLPIDESRDELSRRMAALRPERLRLLTTSDAAQDLWRATRELPDLVLVEANMRGRTAFDVCRARNIVAAADDAPYAAKRSGRDCVRAFGVGAPRKSGPLTTSLRGVRRAS